MIKIAIKTMNNNLELINFLQNVFPEMPPDGVKKLLEVSRIRSYPAGTVICKEGNVEDSFYVILDGEVEITKFFEVTGTERHIRSLGAGEFFGEMGIVVDGPRSATVIANTDINVLETDRATVLKTLADNPTMALALVRITIDRMRANDVMQLKELSNAYEALQRLDRAKLDFIQVAAHELRTPITVIRGYRDVLAGHPMVRSDISLQKIIDGMGDGTDRMLDIVNNMLDVSKIDSQTLQVAFVPVLPRMIFADTLTAFEKALEERRITVKEHHQRMPQRPFIYGDPVLLGKVFYQLLSNAIKYSPDGSTINIITREVMDEHYGHCFEFVVADQGIGISKEQIPYIFEKFYQGGNVSLHSSSKTAFMGGGPGLGLAICKGIIEAHNGKILVESRGKDTQTFPGTTFRVLLPIGEPEEPPKLPPSKIDISKF
jgi:signal transduction histidine kinase